MKNQLDILKGQYVELDFHGMLYKGMLMDVGDGEVFLRTDMDILAFPMDEISDIRPQYGRL